jgi:hypothetical protein
LVQLNPEHIGLRRTFQDQDCPLGQIGPTRTHSTSVSFSYATGLFELFLEACTGLRLSSAKFIQLNTGSTRCSSGSASCKLPFKFFSPSSRFPLLARTPPYLSITSQVCTGTPLLALPLSLLVWLLSLDSDTDSDEPGPQPPGQLTPSRFTSHGPDPLSPIPGPCNPCPDQRSLFASSATTWLAPDAHRIPCPELVPTPDGTHSRRRPFPRMPTASHAQIGPHP